MNLCKYCPEKTAEVSNFLGTNHARQATWKKTRIFVGEESWVFGSSGFFGGSCVALEVGNPLLVRRLERGKEC